MFGDSLGASSSGYGADLSGGPSSSRSAPYSLIAGRVASNPPAFQVLDDKLANIEEDIKDRKAEALMKFRESLRAQIYGLTEHLATLDEVKHQKACKHLDSANVPANEKSSLKTKYGINDSYTEAEAKNNSEISKALKEIKGEVDHLADLSHAEMTGVETF